MTVVPAPRVLSSCKVPDSAWTHFRRVFPIALELAGQSSQFNYPLIGEFGRLLLDYLRAPGEADARYLTLITAHIDAIAAVE